MIALCCFATIYGLRYSIGYLGALIVAVAMWSLTGFYVDLNRLQTETVSPPPTAHDDGQVFDEPDVTYAPPQTRRRRH